MSLINLLRWAENWLLWWRRLRKQTAQWSSVKNTRAAAKWILERACLNIVLTLREDVAAPLCSQKMKVGVALKSISLSVASGVLFLVARHPVYKAWGPYLRLLREVVALCNLTSSFLFPQLKKYSYTKKMRIPRACQLSCRNNLRYAGECKL